MRALYTGESDNNIATKLEEKKQRQEKKIREVRNKLRGHMINTLNDTLTIQNLFAEEPAANFGEYVAAIRTANDYLNQTNACNIVIGFRLGYLLKKVKSKFPGKLHLIKQKEKISDTWASFLIKLYLLAEEFPKLCHCSLPLRDFQKFYGVIKGNIAGWDEWN